MKIKLGVIFGGDSVEHEVSIITAVQAMEFIDEDKYEIVPIYITKEKEWYTGHALRDIENYKDLDNLKRYTKNVVLYNKNNEFVLQSKKGLKRTINTIDIAFPIVHGANIEDGTLVGYLSLIGLPFVGSDIYAAVVGQDKVFMKQIFQANNIPISPYVWFFESEYKEDQKAVLDKIKKLKFPVVVKPSRLGSSVGISKVKTIKDIELAIEEAIQYDQKVVIEEAVENLIEVNCSVLGNYEYQLRSEVEQVETTNDILTYEDKYLSKGKGKIKTGVKKGGNVPNHLIPANISKKLKDEVITLAKDSFKALNSSGVVRIDFLIDKKANKVYVNEMNTIPGSLAFYLWEPAGKSYTELLDDVITLAIKDYKKRSKFKTSFSTNILSNYNGVKGLKGIKK